MNRMFHFAKVCKAVALRVTERLGKHQWLMRASYFQESPISSIVYHQVHYYDISHMLDIDER